MKNAEKFKIIAVPASYGKKSTFRAIYVYPIRGKAECATAKLNSVTEPVKNSDVS